ncbi:phage antirepressor KilAC domain-containing protein [Acinetobacter sp. YH12238]|uniref:phage antirepressor KilAC domain-containing protein n=1 Tax=Acinetobacter sp. YH12238 TaxID=2601165 RepID=UPI0035A12432
MNMLAQPGSTDQVTMSSLELVDYINDSRKFDEKPVQLRHADFMAKVPKVLGLETSEKFRSSYLAGNGEQRPCYRFPKREACLMAMSYSYELQAQVFDRMTAMEQHIAAQNQPSYMIEDPIKRAEKWIEEAKQKQAVVRQLELAAPKAQALDTIANTSQTYCLRECAKTIGIKESDLIDLLLLKKWVYREPSSNPQKKGKLQPYAQYVTCGVFINRASPVMADSFGVERVHLNMQVTAFGLTRITGLVNKNKVVAA